MVMFIAAWYITLDQEELSLTVSTNGAASAWGFPGTVTLMAGLISEEMQRTRIL